MLNIKKIKALNTQVVTTAKRYVTDERNDSGLVLDARKTAGGLMEHQTVVAVGNLVRNIEVGDEVMFSPKRYAQKKYDENSLKNDLGKNPTETYLIPMVMMDGVNHLILDQSDIMYVLEEFEEVPDVKVEKPKTKLIIPKAKTFQV